MRSHILTDVEVSLLDAYLRRDVKLDGFSVLVHRMRTNLPSLKEQVDLVERTLEKIERR
jgi:hypothetical protein